MKKLDVVSEYNVVGGGYNCACYNAASVIIDTTDAATDTMCWGFCCGSTGYRGRDKGYEYFFQGMLLRGNPKRLPCFSTKNVDGGCCLLV